MSKALDNVNNLINATGTVLGSNSGTDGQVLTADGAGDVAWEAKAPIDLLSSGASIRKSDGTTAVLSESGGAVTLENVADISLSGGIYLGGTGAANYLQDYETGSWTPTVNFGDSAWTGDYYNRYGRYTKIGNLVHLQCLVQTNSAPGGMTGNVTITGLPFTNSATMTFKMPISVDAGSGTGIFVGRILTSSDTLGLYLYVNCDSQTAVTHLNYSIYTVVVFSICYHI